MTKKSEICMNNMINVQLTLKLLMMTSNPNLPDGIMSMTFSIKCLMNLQTKEKQLMMLLQSVVVLMFLMKLCKE